MSKGLQLALQYVPYVASALPLGVVLWQSRGQRRTSHDAKLLAAAFFVMFLMDATMAYLGRRGLNNWWVTYPGYWLVFVLLAAVVVRSRTFRTKAAWALVGLLGISALNGVTGPEAAIQIVGGLAVGWLAWGPERLQPYRATLWLYCWAEIPFVALMAHYGTQDQRYLAPWAVYRVIQFAAMLLLLRTLVGKEVAYGLRSVLPGPAAEDPRFRQRAGGRGDSLGLWPDHADFRAGQADFRGGQMAGQAAKQ
jgi:hypothetical protein